MKYSDFQVWFHGFNNAYAALCRNGNNYTMGIVKDEATRVANELVAIFQKVENTPEKASEDLSNLVSETLSKAMGNKK